MHHFFLSTNDAFVKTINEEATEVRKWLLSEAIKAKINKNGDSFIGFLSLISADQRGVIRKMNSAGFAMEGLSVKDSILEHETEAVEVFKAWKDFVDGKIESTELVNFLEGAKVNLVSREFDTLLRKVQKETGARGKERYIDKRVIDFLKTKKTIQFSKSKKDFDKFGILEFLKFLKSIFFTAVKLLLVGLLLLLLIFILGLPAFLVGGLYYFIKESVVETKTIFFIFITTNI